MANLKDLLYGYEESSAARPREFLLENTDKWIPQNGGCALVWTAPAGTTKATFEMWGGGSSGGSSDGCLFGKGGTAGGYAKYYVPVTGGDVICMCSAGTSSSSYGNICGHCGCHTTICKDGTWCMCIQGAYCMDRMVYAGGISCYSCCASCHCCGGRHFSSGPPVLLQEFVNNTGIQSGNTYCFGYSHQYMGSSFGMPGMRPQGTNNCCQSCHGGVCSGYTSCCGQACMNQAYHPAGGGMSAWSHGGQTRCGSPGGGGMIYVVYW